ncbi:hypothetical protein CYJ76_03380 [Kytococcus schroeteri]|uniref:Uncharacterized protein n=1 Tax=Kytococcus schroeteri TaxID=138300 RepID=A0A2I1PCI6_9MICO|nr:hypothetical protein [Kytococcus schroeteri]PKZ42345.1 hypothetical protein CYJ76_03380 [Kytococcus schroeteri]
MNTTPNGISRRSLAKGAAWAAAAPMVVAVDVRNNNVVTNSDFRDIMDRATSWSTVSSWAEDPVMRTAPVGSSQGTITWNMSGTLPANGADEADLRIGSGDGISGPQRWNNYFTVTATFPNLPVIPTLESILAGDTKRACTGVDAGNASRDGIW